MDPMNQILKRITDYKAEVVKALSKQVPVDILKSLPSFTESARPFLTRKKGQIISEFKRRSPSKGDLSNGKQVPEVVSQYRDHAAALSILTDLAFFGGGLEDLILAKGLTELPILRKDFIVSEYQIYEAKAYGADVILLIAASLEPRELDRYAALAHEIGLSVLFEVHHGDELDKLPQRAQYIGVNNRDLLTMKVDIQTSINLLPRLREQFPDGIYICESGVNLENAHLVNDYHGFLVAESLITSKQTAVTIEKLQALLS